MCELFNLSDDPPPVQEHFLFVLIDENTWIAHVYVVHQVRDAKTSGTFVIEKKLAFVHLSFFFCAYTQKKKEKNVF